MLVLSRKRSDVICIGERIRITVVKIERNAVRIGIEAPDGVSILREELLLETEDRAAREAWERSDRSELPSSAPC